MLTAVADWTELLSRIVRLHMFSLKKQTATSFKGLANTKYHNLDPLNVLAEIPLVDAPTETRMGAVLHTIRSVL